MIRKTDYFKLGSFIILGTCMLVAVIIILGAGRYLKTTYLIETYFDESINGLEIGSPVKLRGVNIGRVADIDFVPNVYEQAKTAQNRYVYVVCEITPDLFKDLDKKEFIETITKEEKRGLRVRPTSLGLTGQLFINLEYTAPDADVPLPVTWRPKNPYIPAIPSTMSRIEAAVTTISNTLNGIKQEDIQSIIGDVKSIVSSIDDFMKTEGGKKAGERMLSILEETRQLLHRTNQLMADPATARLIPEAAGAFAGVNKIVTGSADDIIATVAEANAAMASFRKASDSLAKNLSDPRIDKAMSNIAPTLENVTQASRDLTAAVAKVHALVNRLNAVVASEEANIHAILEDTREVMQNINELSGDAKRYPSGMLFGTPPSQATPATPATK